MAPPVLVQRRRSSSLHRTIWYMGAKGRVIRGFLDRVLAHEVPAGGTVVDLMSGTGVVAAYCADRYQVYANDAQRYSQVIAASLIEHTPERKEEFLCRVDPLADLRQAYDSHFAVLSRLYRDILADERALLERFRMGRDGSNWCRDYRAFLTATVGATEEGGGGSELMDAELMARYRDDPRRRPACLVTNYYANLYFGVEQALALDSLRAAIDDLSTDASSHDEDWLIERKRTHYLSAVVHAASVSTSGTSHFAQPRHWRKDSELKAMAARRCVDVWEVFQEYSDEILNTVAATAHRPGNRAYVGDYRDRLANDSSSESTPYRFRFPKSPDLIYLDPPYTADNYSRFYHVLEVLVNYDYPALATDAQGRLLRGRYPAIAERFRSGFCSPRSVEDEFRQILYAAAATGSKLVISYAHPTGLLLKQYARTEPAQDTVKRFRALCQEAYRSVVVRRRPLTHSGQGDSNLQIDELLMVCSAPR